MADGEELENRELQRPFHRPIYMHYNSFTYIRYILRNGEHVQLEGIVLAIKGPIVVLETNGRAANVIMPPTWLVGDEVINKAELFDGEPWNVGISLTIEAIKAEYVKETYKVTTYFS